MNTEANNGSALLEQGADGSTKLVENEGDDNTVIEQSGDDQVDDKIDGEQDEGEFDLTAELMPLEGVALPGTVARKVTVENTVADKLISNIAWQRDKMFPDPDKKGTRWFTPLADGSMLLSLKINGQKLVINGDTDTVIRFPASRFVAVMNAFEKKVAEGGFDEQLKPIGERMKAAAQKGRVTRDLSLAAQLEAAAAKAKAASTPKEEGEAQEELEEVKQEIEQAGEEGEINQEQQEQLEEKVEEVESEQQEQQESETEQPKVEEPAAETPKPVRNTRKRGK